MMEIKRYPLKFKADLKERVWGGRALKQFGLELPDGAIGEGWMISDHPNGVTTVLNGPLAGAGLDEVLKKYGSDWFGASGFSPKTGRFPLLIKWLDCNDDLSIQVHPTDSYENLPPEESGKTEMWYILDAKPGATVIYGLKEGVDRASLKTFIENGSILDALNVIPVEAGDAFFIPAGTVHALCSGVLVAEIQQNSDTTYRLYDYNRLGLDGKLRELHIEDSLNVIAYDGAGAQHIKTDSIHAGEWLNLAASPYFLVDKGIVEGSMKLYTPSHSFVILIIAHGEGRLIYEDGEMSAKAGECFLLPAGMGTYELIGNMSVIRSMAPPLQ